MSRAQDAASAASIRPAPKHPGRCRGCRRRILLRGGVVGYLGEEPHCVNCMRDAAPVVGWALELITEACLTIRGKWPARADGQELAPILTILRVIQPSFETPRRSMEQRGRDAMKRLAAHFEESRDLLLETARDLALLRRAVLRGPVRDTVEQVENLRSPRRLDG